MSELDKRVVKLEFDNAKFEKNVDQSMQTIDKLDEKLQFKNVSKAMEKVKVSFSAFEVAAITVIANITNRIVNLGIQLVKSLSIDNISTGWAKFGEKTISVATMAAQKIRVAGKELTNYSEKIEAINKQLGKLNWFTDETSYNFTDMTDNVGKFTAAGRDLDESVNAMMGIATWAALSGQNAATASSAMFQLAQALGRGYIMTMDWRSIENARMSTEEFKQTVLDTAVAMGEMTKEGGKYITKTGDRISATDFDLSSKWFTSDILLKSLEKYSAAVQRIYEISEETGLTATEVLARYSDELDEFGLKAFRAAQEARTFTDTIRAIKDAVSTGWMNTAEKIFGGYDESKVLWTELANELYKVFAEGGNFRNEILGMWRDLAGRADIFGKHGTSNQGAFWNIYDSIIAVRNLINETWSSIFSISEFSSYSDRVSDLAEKIKSITSRLREFTKRIKDAIESSFELRAIFSGLFSVFKVITQIIYGIAYALDPVVQLIKNIVYLLFNRIAAFGISLTRVDNVITSIQHVSKSISNILSDIIDFLDPVGALDKFIKFISKLYKTIADTRPLQKAADAVKAFIDAFRGGSASNIFTKIADGLSEILGVLGSKIGSSAGNLLEPLYAMISGLSSFMKGLASILKPLITIAGQTLNFVGIVLEVIGNIISKVIEVFNGAEASKAVRVLVITAALLAPLAIALYVIYGLFYTIYSIISPMRYLLTNIADAIYAVGQSFYVKAIAQVLSSIGLVLVALAVSMSIIANIPSNNFARAAITIGILSALLTVIIIVLLTMSKESAKLGTMISQFMNLRLVSKIAHIISSLAFALIAIGLSLKLIASIGTTQSIWNSVAVAITILTAFGSFIFALSRVTNNKINYTKVSDLFRSISWTLLVMGIALKTISSIDGYGEIWNSVLAISAILLAFVYFIKALGEVTKNDIKYSKVTKALRSISWTLLVMSVTIGFLSLFKNFEQISTSILSVGLILSLFAGFISILNITSKKGINYKKTIDALNGVSLTLLAMSSAIFIISSIKDSGKAFTSVLAISTILLAFLGFIMVLNKISKTSPSDYGNILKVMGGINLALIAIAISLKVMSSIGDYKQVWNSVAAISAILLAFLGFIFLLNKIAFAGVVVFGLQSVINSMALSLIAMSLALVVVSKTLNSFENVDWSLLGRLSVLFLILKILGKSGPIGTTKALLFSASLIALSAGLSLFSFAMQSMSSIDDRSFGVLIAIMTGLLGLTFVLSRISKVLKFKELTKLGAALLPLSIGLSILALSMSLFNNVSWDSVFKAMTSLSLMLLMMGIAVKFFFTTMKRAERSIVIGVSLIILATAIAAFAMALQLLNTVSWSSMAKGLLIVAGGLTLLGVASMILKPIITTVVLLSASLLMLGLGLFFAASSLGLFAANLPGFVQALVDNVELIGQAMITMGPVLVTAMIESFKLLFDSMGELVPSIVNLVIELINGIIIVLNQSAGPLIGAIVNLIDKLLKALTENSKSIFKSVFALINALLDALTDEIDVIGKKLVTILIKIIKVITRNMPEIVKSMIDLLIALINSVFNNIGSVVSVLITRLFEFLLKVIPLFLKELIKFTDTLVKGVLLLIANVIKLVIISLGTLSKLFIDLLGGIILILVQTFIGLNRVLYEAMRTILYNIFYALFDLLSALPDDLSNLIGGALKALLGSIVKMVGNIIKPFLDSIGLGGLADDIIQSGQDMINSAKANLSTAILDGSNVTSAIKTARTNISRTMSQITSFITDDVNDGVGEITAALNDSIDALGSSGAATAEKAGENTGAGLVSGLNGSVGVAYNAGKEVGQGAIDGYNDATETASPSKVMERMGKYFVTGLTNGITGNASKAKDSVIGLMNEALSGIESVLDSDMDTEFSIRPIMDLSGVSAGAANISSLMSSINGGNVSVSGQLATSVSKKTNKIRGTLENQNGSIINNGGDVYNTTFQVTSDNPEAIANEVNIRLQKLRAQAKQAKGGI